MARKQREEALTQYVDANFSIRKTDQRVFRAIGIIERKQGGYCKDIVANHRQLAFYSKVDKDTVKRSLERMSATELIDYIPGSTDYSEHKASRIRRKTIKELKALRISRSSAHKVCAVLNGRPITYGSEFVRPTFTVRTTNRIYASNPNIQGKKSLRAPRLAEGCRKGEVLAELDIKAADPTVISFLLGYDKNGYDRASPIQVIALLAGLK